MKHIYRIPCSNNDICLGDLNNIVLYVIFCPKIINNSQLKVISSQIL